LYLARGTGAQALFVIPALELVIAHLADTDNGREVPGSAVWGMVEQLLAAKQLAPAEAPRLVPVLPQLLAEPAPPPSTPRIVSLDPEALRQFVGEYARDDGAPLRVYRHDDALFLIVPELGEAELFPVGRSDFLIQVAPDATASFQDMGAGSMTLRVTADGQRIEGQREGI
jgi:hypothetical protein